MLRGFYRLLVALHPKAFRREFDAEMLWIFDQQDTGVYRRMLFADVVRSLLRQWLKRPALWKWMAVGGGALWPVMAAFELWLLVDRWARSTRVPVNFILCAALGSVTVIALTLAFCVSLFRSMRCRRA